MIDPRESQIPEPNTVRHQFADNRLARSSLASFAGGAETPPRWSKLTSQLSLCAHGKSLARGYL
jgi:hypothetical protein